MKPWARHLPPEGRQMRLRIISWRRDLREGGAILRDGVAWLQDSALAAPCSVRRPG